MCAMYGHHRRRRREGIGLEEAVERGEELYAAILDRLGLPELEEGAKERDHVIPVAELQPFPPERTDVAAAPASWLLGEGWDPTEDPPGEAWDGTVVFVVSGSSSSSRTVFPSRRCVFAADLSAGGLLGRGRAARAFAGAVLAGSDAGMEIAVKLQGLPSVSGPPAMATSSMAESMVLAAFFPERYPPGAPPPSQLPPPPQNLLLPLVLAPWVGAGAEAAAAVASLKVGPLVLSVEPRLVDLRLVVFVTDILDVGSGWGEMGVRLATPPRPLVNVSSWDRDRVARAFTEDAVEPHLPSALVRLRRWVGTPEGKVCLAVALTQGLASLHAVGLCHLDLRPPNIFLAPDAPERWRGGSGTCDGVVIGDLGNASPERGRHGKLIDFSGGSLHTDHAPLEAFLRRAWHPVVLYRAALKAGGEVIPSAASAAAAEAYDLGSKLADSVSRAAPEIPRGAADGLAVGGMEEESTIAAALAPRAARALWLRPAFGPAYDAHALGMLFDLLACISVVEDGEPRTAVAIARGRALQWTRGQAVAALLDAPEPGQVPEEQVPLAKELHSLLGQHLGECVFPLVALRSAHDAAPGPMDAEADPDVGDEDDRSSSHPLGPHGSGGGGIGRSDTVIRAFAAFGASDHARRHEDPVSAELRAISRELVADAVFPVSEGRALGMSLADGHGDASSWRRHIAHPAGPFRPLADDVERRLIHALARAKDHGDAPESIFASASATATASLATSASAAASATATVALEHITPHHPHSTYPHHKEEDGDDHAHVYEEDGEDDEHGEEGEEVEEEEGAMPSGFPGFLPGDRWGGGGGGEG